MAAYNAWAACAAVEGKGGVAGAAPPKQQVSGVYITMLSSLILTLSGSTKQILFLPRMDTMSL